MSQPYEIEWATDDILVMRRRGLLSMEQARGYVADAKTAMDQAPATWGLVADTSGAATQTGEVADLLLDLMQHTVSRGVRRVAVVTGGVVATMQEKRLTTSPGAHAPETIAFYPSYDEAYADVQRALTEG